MMQFDSIFQQPWWLDAVAPNRWGEVAVERDGKIIARMAYAIEKKGDTVSLIMPPLTQTLGPCLRMSTAKYAVMLSDQKDLMTDLILKLPRFDYFLQYFHCSITNWLPFYWQGFQQTTRYTYIIDDLTDEEKIWAGMLFNIRTDIRKARDRFGLHVITDLSLEKFLDIDEMTFRRQGSSLPFSRDLYRALDSACAEKGARKIFFAVDDHGRVHAAVYIIWDKDSAYYLLGGSDPALRNSGAGSLCLWEAIRFASTVTRKFNFGGSMMEPVERFFRAFGAVQTPFFQITKDTRSSFAGRILKRLRQFGKGR